MLKILFIGDIVGRPGRDIVASEVPRLRAELGLDVVIANAENAAAGAGLTGSLAKAILAAGVDVITLGDHVWDQRGWETEIGGMERVCRPANLPTGCPGRDYVVVEAKGVRLAVLTVLGRTFMGLKAECPFLAADAMLARFGGSTDKLGSAEAMLARLTGVGRADAVFVEIHAEATSEKQALGRHLDGRAIAVVGTHTHVPTADAAVLPRGTAFLCDAGMTGPYDSILGRAVEPVVARFLDGMPRRFDVAEGDVRLSGVVVEYDPVAKRATRCELLTVKKRSGT
jgi:metallophosphoesterase (TIGR00282 family)